MNTVGVDPGVTGSIVCLTDSWSSVWDMPVHETRGRGKTRTYYDAKKIAQIFQGIGPSEVFLEEIGAAPAPGKGGFSRGSIATAQLVRCVGLIEGICTALGNRVHLVRPPVWKGAILGQKKTDKRDSLNLARKLFPVAPLNLQKHHNRAEAYLIAHYGRLYLKDES